MNRGNTLITFGLVIAITAVFCACGGDPQDLAKAVKETQSWVAGWGTLALINAGLAQIKNHLAGGHDTGGLGWFFISLLLGPVATFLIVAAKDPTG